MARPVPAATATLQVLKLLASQPFPVPASRIAEALGMPRSSTYHLLAAMADEEFVIHHREERTWGLGVASWELAHGFDRQRPLTRLARIPLAHLVDALGLTAHLVVLHGSDVLYLIEERAPGQPPLASDVGVRLPAHLTASGRAILAGLTPAQVRALHPHADELVDRTGRGPRTLAELNRLLAQARRQGFAEETDEVTEGFSSVAVAVDTDVVRASVAVTWSRGSSVDAERVVTAVATTADEVAARLGGRRTQ